MPAKTANRSGPPFLQSARGVAVLLLIAVLGATGAVQLDANAISDGLGWCLLGMFRAGVWLADLLRRLVGGRAKTLGCDSGLFISSALFWAAFEQAGSSLSLFAERNTDRRRSRFYRCDFAAGSISRQLVSVHSASRRDRAGPRCRVALAEDEKAQPSSPAKFSAGLFFGAAAFGVMVPAAIIASGGRMAGPMWHYSRVTFFRLSGSCAWSPVGLSAMTKLAPERAAGFMMGIWCPSSSIGNWLAGKAASLYSSMPLPELLWLGSVFSIAAAVVLVLLVRPTIRLMGGVN